MKTLVTSTTWNPKPLAVTLAILISILIAFPVVVIAGASPLIARSAIFFAADGMRPDLAERFAAEGAMPTVRRMILAGVHGTNGMISATPPNTGVGWYSLMTGAWAGVHGSTNNYFDKTSDPITKATSWSTTGVLMAETLAKKAEDFGFKVALIEWAGGRFSGVSTNTPVIDYRNFFSRRGVLVNYDMPGQPAGAIAFGVEYKKVTLTDAAGWINVPSSFTTPKETELTITTTWAAVNPTRIFEVYIYDSTSDGVINYDHALLATSKDGATTVATLTRGAWAEVKVTLIGERAGQAAGFYVKAIDLAPNLSKFRLYYTSVTRLIASPPALENYLAANFPTSTSADYAPLEAGIVDEDTYVEQGLLWEAAYHPIFRYIIKTYKPDLVFAGYDATDGFSHQFLALTVPSTPYYEAARAAVRLGYIRRAYAGADATLALVKSLMPSNALTFVASDHGFGAQWQAINAGKILLDAGLQTIEQPGNGRAASTSDKAVAAWAGGTCQVYVNLIGREPSGAVPPGQYEDVRSKIVAAFSALGPEVIDKIFLKEETGMLKVHYTNGTETTTSMLYEYTLDNVKHSRTGDVVIFVKPPYQFDAATRGQTIAFSYFFGQHGYYPDMVDYSYTFMAGLPWANMHSSFFASGPQIVAHKIDDGVACIDLAPTIAFALGIPKPAQAQGRVLYEVFAGGYRGGRFNAAQILPPTLATTLCTTLVTASVEKPRNKAQGT